VTAKRGGGVGDLIETDGTLGLGEFLDNLWRCLCNELLSQFAELKHLHIVVGLFIGRDADDVWFGHVGEMEINQN